MKPTISVNQATARATFLPFSSSGGGGYARTDLASLLLPKRPVSPTPRQSFSGLRGPLEAARLGAVSIRTAFLLELPAERESAVYVAPVVGGALGVAERRRGVVVVPPLVG